MAANSLHSVQRDRNVSTTTVRVAEEGAQSGVLGRVRQVLCGLHGHDSLLQFGRDRMYLKCVSCGHESPGWTLSDAASTIARGTTHTRALVRPELVHARRIA